LTEIRLLTSGAYVHQELAAEFGLLPPAFLPVGNMRLYEHQIAELASDVPVYLTLPESYDIPAEDEEKLEKLRLSVLRIPDNLRLGESVVYALNYLGLPNQPVRILHGDTLIPEMAQTELDLIAVGTNENGYSWAQADIDGGLVRSLVTVDAGRGAETVRPVACGFFAFASSAALIRSITRAQGDFIKGINIYLVEHRVTALTVPLWFDFGHVQTFYRSRLAVTTQRYFNTLHISSSDTKKMQAEAAWFAQVPPKMQVFCARLVQSGEENGRAFYETEYEYLPTLAELYVFGSLDRPVWTRILRSCQEFLVACASISGAGSSDSVLRELIEKKTLERLSQFSEMTGFGLDQELKYDNTPLPSIRIITEDVGRIVAGKISSHDTVMHGDFCFSNILYNARNNRIRVIDPRGHVFNGNQSIFGDFRYDMAKFAHSIIGRYEEILAGRYRLTDDGTQFSIEFPELPQHTWLMAALNEMEVNGVRANSVEIRAAMIGLFLSMLPLHADRPDRQRAFIANALRNYAELKSVCS
jgi:hypothetical protein